MIGTNAISFLQVIPSDFARLEAEAAEAESEAARIFDEFTGRCLGQCEGRRLRSHYFGLEFR